MITFALSAALACPQPDAQADIERQVAAMTRQVEAQNLRQTVETLVGFGSRHVLSGGEATPRGTDAARAFLGTTSRSTLSEGHRLPSLVSCYLHSKSFSDPLVGLSLQHSIRGIQSGFGNFL